MEFRKIFDTIPEQFDRWRPRYCAELFAELIAYAEIGPGKAVLELGPGTGQATDPILHTGCEYCAIELGEHLTAAMLRKYGAFPNFSILNDDFITYDFGGKTFDVIYSAATIQWIPESIAFTKTFDLLKPGGTLAMMRTQGDYKTPNEALYDRIQEVYAAYFKPEAAYVYKQGGFPYANAPLYGFTALKNAGIMESANSTRRNMYRSSARTAIISFCRSRTGAVSSTDSEKRSKTPETASCFWTPICWIWQKSRFEPLHDKRQETHAP